MQSFEDHPLHRQAYPVSLAILTECQRLITSAESTINDDGDIEFRTFPSVETLIDIRKHVVAVSAKLAGGLSSQNRDREERMISVEFCTFALHHTKAALELVHLLLLEGTREMSERAQVQCYTWSDYARQLEEVRAGIVEHIESLHEYAPRPFTPPAEPD